MDSPSYQSCLEKVSLSLTEDVHKAMDEEVLENYAYYPSDPSILLGIIVRQSDGLLNPDYTKFRASADLITENQDLLTELQNAWNTQWFAPIRALRKSGELRSS
jgi:hypothetical protein